MEPAAAHGLLARQVFYGQEWRFARTAPRSCAGARARLPSPSFHYRMGLSGGWAAGDFFSLLCTERMSSCSSRFGMLGIVRAACFSFLLLFCKERCVTHCLYMYGSYMHSLA
jgi:hypothetical protein